MADRPALPEPDAAGLELLPRAGIAVHAPDAARHVAMTGLSIAEEHGRWTDGPQARLSFRLPPGLAAGIVLSIESVGYVLREIAWEQRVEFRAGGLSLGAWSITDTVMRPRRLLIPPEAIDARGLLVLDLAIPSCLQPAALGIGEDRRFLGVLLRGIAWEPRAAARRSDLGLFDPARKVGRESRKSFADKIASGFWARFVTGPDVLDIGWRGGAPEGSVVPIVPGATGVDLDYPGYDGRLLPFPDASQDAVYSSHCLEHIVDHIRAIQEWHRVVRVGGHIITVVPSLHLYERARRPPSVWNPDHRRCYSPASLLAEFEAALAPNSYRVRHLAENDRGYQYHFAPNVHPDGGYEIELVIEKIAQPDWDLRE